MESRRRALIWIGSEPVEPDSETLSYLIRSARNGADPRAPGGAEPAPLAGVVERLRELRDGRQHDYRPEGDEQRALHDALRSWMNDVGLDQMPDSAVLLLELMRYGSDAIEPEPRD